MSNTDLIYTVCFLKSNNKLLLLNRVAKPNMGMWNGVGGKIEAGESAYQSVIREIREETGIVVEQVQFGGIVTWPAGDSAAATGGPARGGMYLFLAEVSGEIELVPAQEMDEGILAWKDISWVMNEQNLGVVSNIRIFLPRLLAGLDPCEYFCTYQKNQLVNCEILPLPDWINPNRVHLVSPLKA